MVNPDLGDSGQTLLLNNIESDEMLVADVNDGVVAPNGAEGDEIATARRGKWWWWLPLIVGIPIIAAILVTSLGRKRSDREPAIDNVPNINDPDGGIGVSGTPGRENLSTVGANASNVGTLGNTVGTPATSIGATTLAEGATANFVAGNSRTGDDIDLDIDRTDLEETDVVTEIPSTPVSEFTGQETKLQITDQPTEIQENRVEDLSSETIGDLHSANNVAASELVIDLDPENTTADSLVEDEAVAYSESDIDISEPQAVLSDRHLEDTFNHPVETDVAHETTEAKEFLGDFVLEEESPAFTPYESTTETDIGYSETLSNSDRGLEEPSTTEFELSDSELSITEIDSDPNLEQQAVETDLIPPEQSIIEVVESERDLYSEPTQADSLERLDDSVLSETTTNDDLSEDFEVVSDGENVSIEVIGFDEAENYSLDKVSLDDSVETVDASLSEVSLDNSAETIDNNLNQSDGESQISIDEIGFDEAEDYEINEISLDDSTEIVNTSSSEISFDEARNSNLDEISFDDSTEIVNASLSEISFDDSTETVDASLNEISFDDSTETVDASLSEISFDETEDYNLDEISFDDSNQTVDASLSEISFDETEDYNLDEISFDDNTEIADASLSEISFNETEDYNLDEISFDDSTEIADVSLSEISFNETEDYNLDEISFDDSTEIADVSLSESQINLDEIGFDEAEDYNLDEISFDDSVETTDANLDEISFNEVDNSDLDEIVFDEVDDSDLDEISFDDSVGTTDANLDRIAFNEVDDSDLDEIGFEELGKTKNDSTSDPLSNSTAGINSFADDESDDMDNITEWLDSLETPNQNTDNILQWLDKLNAEDPDFAGEDGDENAKSTEQANDVSFKFIEDLLETDDENRQ